MTAISSAGPDVVKKRHATKAQNPQALKKKKAFSGPVQRVCKGLNELRAIGMDDPEKKWVAWMSDYVGESPGFVKALSLAKKEGLIEYSSSGKRVSLTSLGRSNFPVVEKPKSNQEMFERLQRIVGLTKAPKASTLKLFALLQDGSYKTMEDVARFTNYPGTHTPGFKKFISTVCSLDIFERDGDKIRLGDIAFPYGRPCDRS